MERGTRFWASDDSFYLQTLLPMNRVFQMFEAELKTLYDLIF